MLLASFEKGLDPRIVVNKHVLRDKAIDDCTGCCHCFKHSFCSIKDDMQAIHQDIQMSDMIVLASPMYWWGVTGLMKIFIDRLYLYYPKNNIKRVAGKKLLALVPMNVNPDKHGLKVYQSEIEPLEMSIKYIFKRLSIDIIDIIFYHGLNEKSAVKGREDYIEHVYRVGNQILSM